MKFIKIKADKILVEESESTPTLEHFVQLLNLSNSRDEVHQLHNEFSDPSLLILCTNAANDPYVAVVQGRKYLFETLLIFPKIPHEKSYSLGGLTDHQIALVEQELKIEPPSPEAIEAKTPFISFEWGYCNLEPLQRGYGTPEARAALAAIVSECRTRWFTFSPVQTSKSNL